MPSEDSAEYTDEGSQTFVIVGCGASKADESVEARDLYTSTYFAKKREYAEVLGDDWRILSAEHGLIDPEETVDPYETSIDDLDGAELDELAHDLGIALIEWAEVAGADEVVVLAGRKYIDPLRKREAFHAGISAQVRFPLQQNALSGIGEQMAWLGDRVENGQQETLEGFA